MCRQNQLWGCSMMAFGLGEIIGMVFGKGFFSFLFGIALIGFGFFIAQRK